MQFENLINCLINIIMIDVLLALGAKGVQKRTLERSKEDRERPKRDSLNYGFFREDINIFTSLDWKILIS